ncbi:MAG: bacillithiol biosynthesis deacetylase BshB1 [Chitinophagales bacterium]|nr:bacillithiol biosynthesis deacetylase BshB1 [Chitinophagales bacterium]
MKLDILAFGSHPDDIELSCGGTLIKHILVGRKAGIIDLTKGELGTRGTPEIREQESAAAAQILGVSIRENLGMDDGFFVNDEKHQREIIRMIRKYQPEIILANAIYDRHPDHGRGAMLVQDASFLAGLRKIETNENNVVQSSWRPKAVYHYIQDQFIMPDILVDITEVIEKKMESVRAYRSQFYNPQSDEPITYIATPEFMDTLMVRAKEFGKMTGVKYAEGFTSNRKAGLDDLFLLK